MNTYDVLSADAADWSRGGSQRSQSATPGNSQAITTRPNSSLPVKGREVEEGKLYSPESELQVLGCVLTDAKVAFTLLHTAEVTANFFYDLRHRELFRLLEEMFAEGDEINLSTVHLRARGSCRVFRGRRRP